MPKQELIDTLLMLQTKASNFQELLQNLIERLKLCYDEVFKTVKDQLIVELICGREFREFSIQICSWQLEKFVNYCLPEAVSISTAACMDVLRIQIIRENKILKDFGIA